MNIDKRLTRLICDLEYRIGNQTYNPNSYNGWTGEEGQEYKYPVYFCASEKDLEKRIQSKTRYIDNIAPECIGTMKYKFGANHLYIGDGIIEVLEHLESIYNLDFNELEEKRRKKNIENMYVIKEKLEAGECVKLEKGRNLIGEDLPAGKYTLVNDEDFYMMAYICNEDGVEKDSLCSMDKAIDIELKEGEILKVYSNLKLKSK